MSESPVNFPGGAYGRDSIADPGVETSMAATALLERAEPTSVVSFGPDEMAPNDLLRILIDEHSQAMFRVAVSIVRDQALAEDVVQESLVRAWQAASSFRADSSLRAWALRISHNTAISVLRKRREELRDPAMLPENSASAPGTDRQVQGRLMVDQLWDALDHLDDLSRTVVVLREVEGLAYEEIAEALQLPLHTVKTRLFRARRSLAQSLKEWQ